MFDNPNRKEFTPNQNLEPIEPVNAEGFEPASFKRGERLTVGDKPLSEMTDEDLAKEMAARLNKTEPKEELKVTAVDVEGNMESSIKSLVHDAETVANNPHAILEQLMNSKK